MIVVQELAVIADHLGLAGEQLDAGLERRQHQRHLPPPHLHRLRSQPGEVEADVARRVQLKAYLDAVTEKNVEVVSDPRLSPSKLTDNQPFAFTATVEVKPKVAAKDYRGLSLPKLDVSVSDEKVKVSLKDPLSPGVLRPVNGEDYTYIIMPMRL